MKKWLIKIGFAGLLGFGLGCLILIIQFFYQMLNQNYWVKLGLPFEFYYFTADFEIHGIKSLVGFVCDALILFGLSFLFVHLRIKTRDKRKMPSENDRLDENLEKINRK